MNAWAEAPGAHERNIIEGIRDVILLSSLPASHTAVTTLWAA